MTKLDSFIPAVKKTFKTPHIGPTTLRQIFLHISSEVMEDQDKLIFERNSSITPVLASSNIKIYNGRFFLRKKISKYAVGFKFGEFTWNRKLALYKAKQLRKKKKKK